MRARPRVDVATEAEAAAALRAAAEVFVPGPPHDPTPGAADIEADRFIAHYLEHLMPGLARAVTDLLDQAAGDRPFASLPLDERAAVLDRMTEHEVEQMRELPSVLGVLAVAAVYGEWTGQDAEGRLVRTPLGWELTGFAGPTRARPSLLR